MSQNPGNPYPPVYQPIDAPKPSGLAVASMVLGIISLVLLCIPYISIPCAIAPFHRTIAAPPIGCGENG